MAFVTPDINKTLGSTKPVAQTATGNSSASVVKGPQIKPFVSTAPTTIPTTTTTTTKPLANQKVDLGNIIQTKDTSFLGTIWNGIKEKATNFYNHDIHPLKYVPQGMTLGSNLLESVSEQHTKIAAHPDIIYRTIGSTYYGEARGLVSGATLGWAKLPDQLWKPKYEEEIEGNMAGAVVGEIAGYGELMEKIIPLAVEAAGSAGILGYMSPKVADALVRTTAFLTTSQLHKNLFFLTPEEKAAGTTTTQKRFTQLLTDGVSLMIYRGGESLLQKAGWIAPSNPEMTFANYINKQTFNNVSEGLKAAGIDADLTQSDYFTMGTGFHQMRSSGPEGFSAEDVANGITNRLPGWDVYQTDPTVVHSIGVSGDNISGEVSVSYPQGASPDKWNFKISGRLGGVAHPDVTNVGEPLSLNAGGDNVTTLSVDSVLPKYNSDLPQDVLTRAVMTQNISSGLTDLASTDIPLKNNLDVLTGSVLSEANKIGKTLDILKANYLTTAATGAKYGESSTPSYDDILASYIENKHSNDIHPMALNDESNSLNLVAPLFTTDLGSMAAGVNPNQLILKYFANLDTKGISDEELLKNKNKYAKQANQTLDVIAKNYSVDGQKFDDSHSLINYLTYKTDVPPLFKYEPASTTEANLAKYEGEFEDDAVKHGYGSVAQMLVNWEDQFLGQAENNPDLLRNRDTADNGGKISEVNEMVTLLEQQNRIEADQNAKQSLIKTPDILSDAGTVPPLTTPPDGGVSKPANFAGQIFEEEPKWFGKMWDKLNPKNLYQNITSQPETIIQDAKLRATLMKGGGFGGKVIPELYRFDNLSRVYLPLAKQDASAVIGNLDKEGGQIFSRFVYGLDLLRDKLSGKDVAGNLSLEDLENNMKELSGKVTPKITESLQRYFELVNSFMQRYKRDYPSVTFDLGDLNLTPEQSQLFLNNIQNWGKLGNVDIRSVYAPHHVALYQENNGNPGVPKSLSKNLFMPNMISRLPGGSPEDIVYGINSFKNYFTTMELSHAYAQARDRLVKHIDTLGKLDPVKDTGIIKWLEEFSRNGKMLDMESKSSPVPHDVVSALKKLDPNNRYFKFVLMGELPPTILPTDSPEVKSALDILRASVPADQSLPEGINPNTAQMLFGQQGIDKLSSGRFPIIMTQPEVADALSKYKQSLPKFAQQIVDTNKALFKKPWSAMIRFTGGTNRLILHTIQSNLLLDFKDPTAIWYIPQAMKYLGSIKSGDFSKINDPFTKSALEVFKNEGIESSTFAAQGLSEFGTWSKAANPLNAAKYFSRLVTNASQNSELSTKTAAFLANVKRLETGKILNLKGAADFVKSMVDEGVRTGNNTLIMQGIAQDAKGVTFDLGMKPKIPSSLEEPFSTFGFAYGRMFDKFMKLLGAGSKALIGFLGAQALLGVWNNTGDRQKYENGLSPSIQKSFHAVVGELPNGKVLTLKLPLPFDGLITGMFDFPDVIKDSFLLSNDLKNLTDPKDQFDAVKMRIGQMVSDVLGSPLKELSFLGSPIIKLATGITTNVDPYTGRAVVPTNLMADPLAKMQYRSKYVIETLASFTMYGEQAAKEYDPQSQFGMFLLASLGNAFNPLTKFEQQDSAQLLQAYALQTGDKFMDARWTNYADQIETSMANGDVAAVTKLVNGMSSFDSAAVMGKVYAKFKSVTTATNVIKIQLQNKIATATTQEEKDRIQAQLDSITASGILSKTSKLNKLYDTLHGFK